MINCSKFVSDKTGSVVFVRKNDQIICSETWENAYKLIFQTKATVEYIDLDNGYSTTRVDAKADEANFAIMILAPAEYGNDSKLLEITYSLTDGISEKEVSGGGDSELVVTITPAPDMSKFTSDVPWEKAYEVYHNGGKVKIRATGVAEGYVMGERYSDDGSKELCFQTFGAISQKPDGTPELNMWEVAWCNNGTANIRYVGFPGALKRDMTVPVV